MGQGPPLVKAANWLSHLEHDQASPVWRHWLRELSRDHTLIRYDERGCGLSDWDVGEFSVDAWVRDLEAVVEAAGLDRFALLGISQGGPVAIAYAARHPDRISHLVLYGTYGRGWRRESTPDEVAEREALLTLTRVGWGRDDSAYRQVFTSLFLPEATEEQFRWFTELQRVSTSPENAVRFQRAFSEIDVADLLDRLPVAPLILHARDDLRVPFEAGRRLAARIPDSRFVSLPSRNHILLEHEDAWSQFLREVRTHLGVALGDPGAGIRSTERAQPSSPPEELGPGPRAAHKLLDMERRQRIEEIFEAALDVKPEYRQVLLDAECGGDVELRAEVSALLRAHERPRGVLELPPDAFATEWAPTRQIPTSPAGGLSVASTPRGLIPRLWDQFLRWISWRRARAAGQVVPSPTGETAGEPRGTRVAHYEVRERIGGGGMGVVYRATDSRLDRTVALKFLPAHLSSDREARERFLVEAQAAAALDHPHICTIHEIGTAPDGRLYIAMPCYEGETLRDKIGRGPLDLDEAIELGIQVARGLAKAHQFGVIHRDIKPANVLVTHDGLAKIVDFGLAKLSGIDLTRTGMAMGTVAYMSPEQAMGEPVDARTDLWSLGVVLYEMVTGQRPFRGDSSVATLHAILKREPERIARRRPDVPGELEEIINRCLQKRVDDRVGAASEVLEVLHGLQSSSRWTHRIPGEAISEITPGGERRHACVLVSSIATFSELVERLSPAELNALMERIEEEATRVTEGEGGIVNSCTGDQIVALFGIPTAHEDDFRRAVSAAVALHAALGELSIGAARTWPFRRLELRTGIGTGAVVVQHASVPDRRYRIAGLAADTGARLSAHAAAGEILVSEECSRRVAPFYVTQAGEPLLSRSGAERITPFRVAGERPTGYPAEVPETLTAFVGRERELALLEHACSEARRGTGCLVSVVGEAGTGKSRLLREFRESIAPDTARVLGGRCPESAVRHSFGPFVEVLRERLGIEPNTAPPMDEIRRHVLSISPQLEASLPYFMRLLGLEPAGEPVPEQEPEQQRIAIQDALCTFLTEDAGSKPLAVLLENWHHSGEGSRQVLRRLSEMVGAHPLLLVVTARPDANLDWGTSVHHLPIHLGPLTPEDSEKILRSVWGADTLPSGLAERLHSRTGGNPLFLQEIGRTLLEDGVVAVRDARALLARPAEALELPETVQGVIRSRLDALDPPTRLVVTHAAVIGREFSQAILERTLEDVSGLPEALHTLRERGLAHQIGVLPSATYRFAHAPVQEVAYDGLLRHRQKELHQKVAEAIEQLNAESLEPHFARLAFHYTAAGIGWKAVLYGQKAAERAEELSQFGDALDLLDQTLDAAERLLSPDDKDELRLRILFKQERLCETLGLRERQQRICDQLIRLLEPSGPSERLSEAHLRKGDLFTLTRQHRDAERQLSSSLNVARQIGDRAAERNALRSIGLLRWHQERNEEAIALQEQALAIDRELGDAENMMLELSNLGNLYKGIGRHDEALRFLEEAVQVRERYEGENTAVLDAKLSYVLHNIGNIYRALGDNQKALQYINRAASHARGSLTAIQRSYHLMALANIRLQEGRIEETLELYREAVTVSRRAGSAEALAQGERVLGEVLIGLGRPKEAIPHLEEAATTFAQLRDREAEAVMWQAVAQAFEIEDRRAEAEAAWDRVRILGERYHDDPRVLAALGGLARLARWTDPKQALRLYERAIPLAQRLGDRPAEASLLNSLAILAWRRQEHDRALDSYRRALHIYKDLEDWVHAGLILNSLGVTLRDMGQVDEARANLEEALEVNRMTGERLLQAHSLAVIGELAQEAGDLEAAVARFEESLELRRELDDRLGEGWMMVRLARAKAELGSAPDAQRLLGAAAQIAEELADPELADACRSTRP
ncbi:MAG: alpha/beta fold hydrolase [Gemmatimonadota bacterium]|nr:MAG: alpha/beta fold hydrolase [Gemmatimonadota bacterium]